MFLVCLLIFLIVLASPTMALAKFTTNYAISYQINETGSTHVVFDISQTNNLSQVYATDFGLSVGQTNINNIVVTDIDKRLEPNVTRTNNLTAISFTFANKVVGRDKEHKFRIEYDTTDIAEKHGSVWEVNIPKLENNEDIASQIITISIPNNFPELAYIDPPPTKKEGNTYFFTSSNLANRPISALFGKTQYYQLNIEYHLSNPSVTPDTQEISLPPNTSYQKVYLRSLEPKPILIKTDPDGNWLASYKLGSQQDQTIKLDAVVKIDFNPQRTPLANSGNLISSNNIWDYQNPVFNQAHLNNLNTPQSIYNFVVSHLKYNYAKVSSSGRQRLGAVKAFENPDQAICTEFTDLFVSLARKKGIPAREIQGYAISQNDILKPLSLEKDVLHSWPEYYDSEKQTWIQVDPTWGNTTNGIDYFKKLDLNHIAFVLHGNNPTEPAPAGAYRTANTKNKTINVSPTNPIEFPKATVNLELMSQSSSGITIKMNNTSPVAYEGPIKASISQTLDYQDSVTLAPYSEKTIVLKPKFSLTAPTPLIININGQEFTYKLSRTSFFPIEYFIGAVVVAIIAIVAWSLRLRRQRPKPPIHW